MSEKKQLRREVRLRFPGDEQRDEESRLICEHILQSSLYQQASVVAGYVALRREADVSLVLEQAILSGKTVALPRVEADGVMTMRVITSDSDLVSGSYGIPEPATDAPIIDPASIDLLLTPLEAIDHTGMRLGKGGGYYDRLLSNTHLTTVGVVLSNQWVSYVPADPWDMPLQYAVDHTGITVFTPPLCHDRKEGSQQ